MGDKAFIHPTAVVADGAEIGLGSYVGPYCIVGEKVKLGDGVRLDSHVVVSGRVTIGSRTRVWPFATIGSTPQDLKYRGEDSGVEIGECNSIREYVNVSLGTEGGGMVTRIGDHNLIMVYTHVAHDCTIHSHCIIANSVQLAGHVTVEDHAVIGGTAAVHQFCRIGRLSMMAGGSIVVQDLPPFCMVQGDRGHINGLNVVGLRRAGFKRDQVARIKTMYRLLYKENLTLDDAVTRIETEVDDSDEKRQWLHFLSQSQRGVCR